MSERMDLASLRERAAELVRKDLGLAATALVAALAPLGAVGDASAGVGDGNTGWLGTNVFPDELCGSFSYELTIFNSGPDDLTSFMVPIYDIDAVCYVYAPEGWTWELVDARTAEIWDIDTDMPTGTYSGQFASSGGAYGTAQWDYDFLLPDPNAAMYTRPDAFGIDDLPFVLYFYTTFDEMTWAPDDAVPAGELKPEFYFLTPYPPTPAPHLVGHLFAGMTLGIASPGDGYEGIMPASPTYTMAPPECAGDTNGDDTVDFADLNEVLDNWGQTVPPGTMGDVDDSGTVDFADLNIVLDSWGESC